VNSGIGIGSGGGVGGALEVEWVVGSFGRVTSTVMPKPAAANPTMAATATAARRLGRKLKSVSLDSPAAFRKVVDCLPGGTDPGRGGWTEGGRAWREGGRVDCGNTDVLLARGNTDALGGNPPETGGGVAMV
jgi:hypothetical protein